MRSQVEGLRDQFLDELTQWYAFFIHTANAYELAIKEVTRSNRGVNIFYSAVRPSIKDYLASPNTLISTLGTYRDKDLQVWVFIQFVMVFETFFFELLKLLMANNPLSMPRKDKTLEWRIVIECADRDEILTKIIETELNQVKYETVSGWFKYLDKVITIGKLAENEREQLAEMKASRDIIVHNAGIVNDIYLKKAGALARYPKGASLEIPLDYFVESFRIVIGLVGDIGDYVAGKV